MACEFCFDNYVFYDVNFFDEENNFLRKYEYTAFCYFCSREIGNPSISDVLSNFEWKKYLEDIKIDKKPKIVTTKKQIK